ncbi:MAG: c-type cytochrome biogenesis protein CcmI, partial [Pseudomonadota bacterium]
MFWLLAISLTLVAVVIGFRPLITRVDKSPSNDSAFDTAVYRDQLAELEADKKRGTIDAAEYEQARIEVALRINAVQDRADKSSQPADTRRGGFIGATFAILFVPGIAFLFYSELGSPSMNAQPLAARITQPEASEISGDIALMLERAEEHLRVNPNDVRGWDVVAPVYLQTNRFNKAITAYNNAISLDGATTARLAGLGEAMVSQNGGVIDGDALIRFQAALQIDPADTRSNFFIALAAAQAGNLEKAETVRQGFAR